MVVHFRVEEQADSKERDTPGATELLKSWGGPAGLPFHAFLDGQGKLIVNSLRPADRDGKHGGNIGHPAEPYEIDYFLTMVHKAAPRMTGEEADALEKWLRAQKK